MASNQVKPQGPAPTNNPVATPAPAAHVSLPVPQQVNNMAQRPRAAPVQRAPAQAPPVQAPPVQAPPATAPTPSVPQQLIQQAVAQAPPGLTAQQATALAQHAAQVAAAGPSAAPSASGSKSQELISADQPFTFMGQTVTKHQIYLGIGLLLLLVFAYVWWNNRKQSDESDSAKKIKEENEEYDRPYNMQQEALQRQGPSQPHPMMGGHPGLGGPFAVPPEGLPPGAIPVQMTPELEAAIRSGQLRPVRLDQDEVPAQEPHEENHAEQPEPTSQPAAPTQPSVQAQSQVPSQVPAPQHQPPSDGIPQMTPQMLAAMRRNAMAQNRQ